MNFVIFSFVLFGLLANGCARYETGDVIVLTTLNFQELVIQNDFVWIVQFYAPWSIDSKNIRSKYEKLATDLKHKIKVGAVDGSEYKPLRDLYKVTISPTIKIFGANKSVPYTGLLDETVDTYKFIITNNNHGKSTSSAGLIHETFKLIIECAMDEKAKLESKFNNDDEDSRAAGMEGSGHDVTQNSEEMMLDVTTTEEVSPDSSYEYDEYEEIIDDFTIKGSSLDAKEIDEETTYIRHDPDDETITYSTTESEMAETSVETTSETIEELNLNKSEYGITNSAINIKNLSNITVTIILISLFKLLFIESQ